MFQREPRPTAALTAFFVFSFCVLVTSLRSRYLWFWTDEAFAAFGTLGRSWLSYLRGDTGEGNTAPLYFLFLKALAFIQPWVAARGGDSVLLLRMTSIVPMALTAVFFFREVLREQPEK